MVCGGRGAVHGAGGDVAAHQLAIAGLVGGHEVVLMQVNGRRCRLGHGLARRLRRRGCGCG